MELDQYVEDFRRRDWETTTPDTLRVAVVGLGGFARYRALPAIEESDYCAVGAVVSRDSGTARAVAEEYDAAALTAEEYADGAGTDSYDAAYVITPNARHLSDGRVAAEQGAHVLCEKPLEADADRAAELIETCERAGVTLMTAYRLQTDPALRRAREAVRDGVIGDPVQVHGDHSFRILAGDRSPDQWRLDPALAGGGALYDVGVYPLNTTRFLLDVAPVSVIGHLRSPDPAFDGVDEHAAFQVRFEGGVVGAFTASYGAQQNQLFEVAGTEGRLAIEPPYDTEANRRLVVERGDERVAYRGEYTNEIAEQLDYFAHAVHTDTRPEPDGRDGLTDVRVLDAVRGSPDGTQVEL
jgi:predicted dehydrogenase